MITLGESAPEVECVILMDSGTCTAGCNTVMEMELTVSFVHWKASLIREPSLKDLSLRVPSHK